MFRQNKHFLYFALALTMLFTATAKIPSVKLLLVYKQLYCDVIISSRVLNFVGCATQCLNEVDACEGISLKKEESLDMKACACKVCLVKAVKTPMKLFTVPSTDTRIYRRVINMDKGKNIDIL